VVDIASIFIDTTGLFTNSSAATVNHVNAVPMEQINSATGEQHG